MILYGRIGRPLERKTTPNGKQYYLLTVAGNRDRADPETNWYVVRAFLDEMDADMLGKGAFVKIPMGRLSGYAKEDNLTQKLVGRLAMATWNIEQVEPSEGDGPDGKRIESILTGRIMSEVQPKLDDQGVTYYEFTLVENHTRKRDGSSTWYDVKAYIDDIDGEMLENGIVVRLTGKPSVRAYIKDNEKRAAIGFKAVACEQVVSKKESA